LPTPINLLSDGFILRRKAFNGIRDPTGFQGESVSRRGLCLGGKPESMQCFEQHDSGVIAGKGSTRRICAMKTGRKTHDQ